ncbi:sulfatase [Polaribacter haliotis]|uniref:Sulfatase n=1 Tax=Polaribacter haliotis TaxID=1888915 RepID=A0A7L8AIY6_9FLAO|nr:sulfatase [Polaribacter haliotis]QOD61971.1 sulfatase [Polaribacter haliotis]
MKNIFKNSLLLIAFSLVFTSCKNQAGVKKETIKATAHKNVLFIAVDDLKPILGAYGSKVVKTPNIDKLATNGFVMKNNHCQQAVCGPSRASILSGKRPDYTKIWDLKTKIRSKNPDILTIPQYYKEHGYESAPVGKIFDFRSVDKQHDSISWNYNYLGIKHKMKEYVTSTEHVSYEVLQNPDSTTADGKVASRSIKLLRKFAKEKKPFFLGTGFHKPHLPFVVPQKYWDMYPIETISLPEYRKDPEGAPRYATQPSWELRGGYADFPKDYSVPISEEKQKKLIQGYYASVSFVDAQIGLVIDELDRLGLRENTVIVLWGDHGWHLGDHNMYCKHTNYEQSTRSPLIISAGKNRIGESNSPTEFVDIFPTLLDLTGLKNPGNLDGVSLVPLMESKVDHVKDFAVSQFPRESDKMGYTFRNDTYRYTVWMKDNWRSDKPYKESLLDADELYDYDKDPQETKNLVNEVAYKSIKADLKAKAIAYFKSQETK